MRLQMVSLPDIVDGGLAHPLGLGEQPTTPLGHASRLAAQRRRHDRRDLAPPVAWLAAPARGHFPQTVQPLLRKALAPQRDRLAIDLTSSGNGIVGLPFSRRKHYPTPQGNLLWGTEGRHPLPQLLFICLFELQRWRRSRHPFIIVRPCVMSSYLLDIPLEDVLYAALAVAAAGGLPATVIPMLIPSARRLSRTAFTAWRISSGPMAPMHPTRKVSSSVSFPG